MLGNSAGGMRGALFLGAILILCTFLILTRPPTPPSPTPCMDDELRSYLDGKVGELEHLLRTQITLSRTRPPASSPQREREKAADQGKNEEQAITTTTTTTAAPPAASPTADSFAFSKPWMDPVEIAAVDSVINGTVEYLEWGTGGSTLTWARQTKHARCIEHSGDWCKLMQEQIKKRAYTHVEFFCVAVDKGYKGWGGGFEEGSYDQFEEYINKIHSLNVPKGSLDVVLVDGRARLSCALTAIPYLKPHGTLIIHDYTFRNYYHGAEKYFDRLSTHKSLVLLRPKPEAYKSPPSKDEIRTFTMTFKY